MMVDLSPRRIAKEARIDALRRAKREIKMHQLDGGNSPLGQAFGFGVKKAMKVIDDLIAAEKKDAG